ILSYRDASSEWPVVRIERGGTTAWLALEDGRIVRYDHIDLAVGPDGRAGWNGRVYTRAEMGNATVSRVVGPLDVAVGATPAYQALGAEPDPRGRLAVEAWPSGVVDGCVGRSWRVVRLVTGRDGDSCCWFSATRQP